jgi:ABC-2 type transport system ATP-binding protein
MDEQLAQEARAHDASGPILALRGLSKTYNSGHQALKAVDLEIWRGEIFALLGPNGAGKTTLIGAVCGLVRPSTGTIRIDGLDVVQNWRAARAKIGLVPQEMSTDMFETVEHTVSFSRGLFGKPRDAALVRKVLEDLSLWDKRSAKIMALSGGMKRRVMIAKALAHEPDILFLDEPTAGVDVELRRDLWAMVRGLRARGVTIILTTHYIEEAEDMADRVGVIAKGELMLVEDKTELMKKLGKKQLRLTLAAPMSAVPDSLVDLPLELTDENRTLVYTFDSKSGERTGVGALMQRLAEIGIAIVDLDTHQSSLEDIFVNLVRDAP